MKVLQFNPQDWPMQSALVIHNSLKKSCRLKQNTVVMLTGGRSAERLYLAWRELLDFSQLRSVHFFFSDERCVLPSDPESNYLLVMRSLFAHGVPLGCYVHRLEAEKPEPKSVCLSYERQLPDTIDILILSVGEDGHIASLFPGSEALDESLHKVAYISSNKYPNERITITPLVIKQSSEIFVLCNSEAKNKVCKRVLDGAENFRTLPAVLLKNGIWLLDKRI